MTQLTGFHAIEEFLKSNNGDSKKSGSILVTQSGPRIKAILELAKKINFPVHQVTQVELNKKNPENRGIILETNSIETAKITSLAQFLDDNKNKAQSLVVILDHIEDPQNFGAILRSCEVFAVDLVIAPVRRAAPMSASVARASAGASAHVPLLFVNNLADQLRLLKKAEYWTYCADMSGTALPQAELDAKTVFVLGNEGAGVSRLLKNECDATLAIPQWGSLDSLNVSATGAIFLYEYRRSFGAR